MPVETYKKGMPYEWFIRMANNNQRGKNGGESALMTNLINAENGERQFKLGTAAQQLAKIKNYMIKAMDKYLKVKVTPDEKLLLLQRRVDIENAYSSEELLRIIEEVYPVMLKYYRK